MDDQGPSRRVRSRAPRHAGVGRSDARRQGRLDPPHDPQRCRCRPGRSRAALARPQRHQHHAFGLSIERIAVRTLPRQPRRADDPRRRRQEPGPAQGSQRRPQRRAQSRRHGRRPLRHRRSPPRRRTVHGRSARADRGRPGVQLPAAVDRHRPCSGGRRLRPVAGDRQLDLEDDRVRTARPSPGQRAGHGLADRRVRHALDRRHDHEPRPAWSVQHQLAHRRARRTSRCAPCRVGTVDRVERDHPAA